MDAGQVCSGMELTAWHHILPHDVKEFSEVGYVKVVQCLGVMLVLCALSAGVKQCSKNYCFIHLQLCL